MGRPLRPRGKLLQEDARRHHRSLLLQQLFRGGPASRADLARTTGLTRVTVSDLVGELVGEGRLEELGVPVESRVGKPPTLVGLAADSAHIVAIDLSGDVSMTGAVINLAGEVKARHELAVDGRRGDDAVALLHRLAAELVAMTDRPVLGVGVGSPGVVDAHGTVLDAPNLAWVDVPLASGLRAALGVPVFVANDANTAVLGEHTFGDTGDGGLMVIRVGTGVGAGLVLEGSLLHGHRSAAGEIGHVVVDPDGEECACSRRGCLETLLAVPRLRRRLAAGRPHGAADPGRRAAGHRPGARRRHPEPARGGPQRAARAARRRTARGRRPHHPRAHDAGQRRRPHGPHVHARRGRRAGRRRGAGARR